jgi:hypothetical protein
MAPAVKCRDRMLLIRYAAYPCPDREKWPSLLSNERILFV